MISRLFLPVLVISCILLSCQQTKVDLKAEEAALRKTDSTWSSLADVKDMDKAVSYWSDDAVVIPPGQPIVKGKEALKKFVENSKNIPGFSISWKSYDIHFSSDAKLAYMYGENLMTMNDSTGKKMSFPGRGYTIWRKEADGNWKCVVDFWNDAPPTK
jgi:ketosteroid isomerase-like protein